MGDGPNIEMSGAAVATFACINERFSACATTISPATACPAKGDRRFAGERGRHSFLFHLFD
jgi:hypothetical protein